MTTQFGMPWPAEDCAKILALAEEGKTMEQIGEIMGRKPGAIRTKLKRLRPGSSFKRASWSEEEKAKLFSLRDGARLGWTEIADRLGRPSGTVYAKYVYLKNLAKRGACVQAAYGFTVPQECIDERARRLAAPLTIAAYVLGDPKPGYSALDRKRQGLPV